MTIRPWHAVEVTRELNDKRLSWSVRAELFDSPGVGNKSDLQMCTVYEGHITHPSVSKYCIYICKQESVISKKSKKSKKSISKKCVPEAYVQDCGYPRNLGVTNNAIIQCTMVKKIMKQNIET